MSVRPGSKDRHAWFAAKSYGIGAGLPIRWQGWVALATCLAVLMACSVALTGTMRLVALLTFGAAFALICARRTAGGWRWRWGK